MSATYIPAGSFYYRSDQQAALQELYKTNPAAVMAIPAGAYVTQVNDKGVTYYPSNPSLPAQQTPTTTQFNSQNSPYTYKQETGFTPTPPTPTPTTPPQPTPAVEAAPAKADVFATAQKKMASIERAAAIEAATAEQKLAEDNTLSGKILQAGEVIGAAFPGGLLGAVGLGPKPQVGPLSWVTHNITPLTPLGENANPLSAVAGVVAAGENVVYNAVRSAPDVAKVIMEVTPIKPVSELTERIIGGEKMVGASAAGYGVASQVIDEVVPKPPLTLSSELVGAGVAAATGQQQSGGLSKVVSNPAYAFGTIVGDIGISLATGKIINYVRGPTATKVIQVKEVERAAQFAPDEYATQRITSLRTEKVPISRAEYAAYKELGAPTKVDMVGTQTFVGYTDEGADFLRGAAERVRPAEPYNVALAAKEGRYYGVNVAGEKVASYTDVAQDVSSAAIVTKSGGVPVISQNTLVKGSGPILPKYSSTNVVRTFDDVLFTREVAQKASGAADDLTQPIVRAGSTGRGMAPIDDVAARALAETQDDVLRQVLGKLGEADNVPWKYAEGSYAVKDSGKTVAQKISGAVQSFVDDTRSRPNTQLYYGNQLDVPVTATQKSGSSVVDKLTAAIQKPIDEMNMAVKGTYVKDASSPLGYRTTVPNIYTFDAAVKAEATAVSVVTPKAAVDVAAKVVKTPIIRVEAARGGGLVAGGALAAVKVDAALDTKVSAAPVGADKVAGAKVQQVHLQVPTQQKPSAVVVVEKPVTVSSVVQTPTQLPKMPNIAGLQAPYVEVQQETFVPIISAVPKVESAPDTMRPGLFIPSAQKIADDFFDVPYQQPTIPQQEVVPTPKISIPSTEEPKWIPAPWTPKQEVIPTPKVELGGGLKDVVIPKHYTTDIQKTGMIPKQAPPPQPQIPTMRVPTTQKLYPPNFPRPGSSKVGGKSYSLIAGTWREKKNPVKTYRDMLKTFGVGVPSNRLGKKAGKRASVNLDAVKKSYGLTTTSSKRKRSKRSKR